MGIYLCSRYNEVTMITLTRRPRRNRKSTAIRSLVQETHLHPSQFVAPLFITEGYDQLQPISSMPGIYRFSTDRVLHEVESLLQLGIQTVDLFPYVPEEKKDQWGTEALREGNLMHQTIKMLKKEFPELCVMLDVALDPYTSHGHDGILSDKGVIENDATLEILGKMSVLAAEAGVDIIAPSDMMDGRVGYIRDILDEANFSDVNILSYAAKFASAFYGPFRNALDSYPRSGDKKSYQLNPANRREALLESILDESEGADMLLVKPALAYLDILADVRSETFLPVGAYHVSGEYSMVMAAAERGWLDADKVFLECLTCIKRAGADFIFTYAAKRIANIL